MKRACALISFFVLSQTALSQWVLQPKVTTADLIQVRFIDRNTGWALGRFWASSGAYNVPANKSSLLRTTDAGRSWSELVLETGALHGLSIVSRSIGWAVGTSPGGSGLIIKTTDGGSSWFLLDSSATRSQFWSVQFLDELHGWIGGWKDTAGLVTRTTDGGLTWHAQYDTSLDVNELFFLDPMNGWAVGENGKIYKTSDAGSSWQAVYQTPGYSTPLRRIRFSDRLHGCAVGGIAATETKVWTSDGGVSWSVVMNSPPTAGSSLHGLWFNDANNGWCVGGVNAGLTIQRTTDGGKTWAKQALPAPMTAYTNRYFEDVVFVSASEGWIVGDDGTMLKTTTAGDPATGIAEAQSHQTVSTFQLNQNYPNPFNPSTFVSFVLRTQSSIRLTIFDALGRQVALLASEDLPAGTYTRRWDASGFPSGVYLCRLQAGPLVQTRTLVLLK